MEVITIDSSDDEEGAILTTARRPPIVTPRESQTQPYGGDDDDDCSSVSSADSIWNWNNAGLPSRLKARDWKDASYDSGDASVLVISDDERSGLSGGDRRAPAASRTSSRTRDLANRSYETVSSNDSIWVKSCLPSRRCRSGDLSREVERNVVVDVDRKGDDDDADHTLKQTANTAFEVGNDCSRRECSVARSLDANQIQDAVNCDESSVSSADSLWDKIGSLKVNDECSDCGSGDRGIATSLDAEPTQDVRDKDHSSISSEDNKGGNGDADHTLKQTANTAFEVGNDCGSRECGVARSLDADQTQDAVNCDESSISSADSLWDKIGSLVNYESNDCSSGDCAVATPLDAEPTQDARHKDSSISSEDSIWDKTGLPPRPKTAAGDHRVETYYDYLRLKARRRGDGNDAGNKSRSNGSKPSNRERSEEDPTLLEDPSPPEVPLPVGATWRIVLLMDHREFGCANNFLQTVEKRINKHFGGKFAEITTLPSADYMYVARLISDTTGEVMDERLMDMVIERKNVVDACSCLITDSKKYKPLSFFEAQMYKLQNCGVSKKLFIMEGDEDKTKNMFSGAKSQMEKERRLKRVKTLRKQLENGEFEGVDIICTRSREHTVKFLIQQLESFLQSFNPKRPPTQTREKLKLYIDKQMKAPTLREYLRLRKIPGIGDAKAMKVIMDPNLHWNKSFISPSTSKKAKSSLDDRATFWRPLPKQKDGSVTSKTKIKKGVLESTAKPMETKSKKSNVKTLHFFDCQTSSLQKYQHVSLHAAVGA